MIMDNQQQKIDVRISDIIVSISPRAVRTLIAVTSSLGTLQVDKSRIIILYIKFLFVLDNGFRRKRKSEFEIII